jgi:hypothetical protein
MVAIRKTREDLGRQSVAFPPIVGLQQGTGESKRVASFARSLLPRRHMGGPVAPGTFSSPHQPIGEKVMRDFCVLVVLGAIGVAAGFYMGEGRSDERAALAAAAAPQVPEGTGYLPARVTNQAREIEPLPVTF